MTIETDFQWWIKKHKTHVSQVREPFPRWYTANKLKDWAISNMPLNTYQAKFTAYATEAEKYMEMQNE